MGSRKRPHDETIESGRLSFERKAWHMLMVTNSIVAIILNSFLLPIIEEVRVGTSHRTISTCIMHYSKFGREPSACSKVLNGWSLTRTERQRQKSVGNSQKWSR